MEYRHFVYPNEPHHDENNFSLSETEYVYDYNGTARCQSNSDKYVYMLLVLGR